MHDVISPVALSVVLILFTGALTRSTFGFGEALVAMPLLSLVIDVRVAAAVVGLTSIINAVAILSTGWESVQWRPAWRLVATTLAGIPLGVYALVSFPADVVKLILAAVVIGFAAYNLWRPQSWQIRNENAAFGFGLVAGVLGGAYNTLGPPLVMFGTLRRWPAREFRCTLQAVFLPASLFVVTNHFLQRLWNAEVFHWFLISLPGILLAAPLGHRLSRKLGDLHFARMVFVLLVAVGLVLLFSVLKNLYSV